jgi:hypothetical protein
MATPNTATDAAPAHEGAHYANPDAKQLLGPIPKTDRASVQRVVWPLFLCVVLGGLVIAAALGLAQ